MDVNLVPRRSGHVWAPEVPWDWLQHLEATCSPRAVWTTYIAVDCLVSVANVMPRAITHGRRPDFHPSRYKVAGSVGRHLQIRRSPCQVQPYQFSQLIGCAPLCCAINVLWRALIRQLAKDAFWFSAGTAAVLRELYCVHRPTSKASIAPNARIPHHPSVRERFPYAHQPELHDGWLISRALPLLNSSYMQHTLLTRWIRLYISYGMVNLFEALRSG